MIFLRVGWMDRYRGLASGDAIRGGGAFVAEHGYGHEIFNFRSWNGQVYGYVRPPGTVRDDEAKRTINIRRLGAGKYDKCISHVLAVWVATRPEGGTAIVGWYKNATIYRAWQKPPTESHRNHAGSDFGYFVTAAAEDAILLPKDERLMLVPQGKDGIGQSNIWYADRGAAHQSLRQAVEEFVTTHRLPQPSAQKVATKQPDPFLRQQVERAAVAVTADYYAGLGYKVNSVERDNVGWDLTAVHPNLTGHLKLEVKGLSGQEMCVEVTPNEYARMKEHRNEYRLCVVTNAFQGPKRVVFAYSQESHLWEDPWGRILQIEEVIAARCSARAAR